MISATNIRRTAVAAITGSLMMWAGVAQSTVTLRMGSEEPFSKPPRVAAQYGLDWLAENAGPLTDGEVKVRVSGNATLGPEKELLKSVAAGVIDACVASPGNTAALVPEVQLFSASYLFKNFDHAMKVLENDAFFERLQQIVRDRNLGMQLAAVSLTGSRNLYNRVRTVDSMEDLDGLKMRVMNSPAESRVWGSLGTLPTTIPAPEIYSALQSGVVDAGESSISAIVASKYYEVAPNITLTHHQFNLMFYFIGDKALQKVPEESRDEMMAAFREAGMVQARAAVDLQERSLQFLKDRPKVTVTEIDVAPMQERLLPFQDELAASLKVEDLLKIVRDAAGN